MTAEAARRHELPVQVVAEHRTVEGLVHSLSPILTATGDDDGGFQRPL